MKKQPGWQTGERVPSVLWRLRLAAGWSVALLDPNLSQISLRRRRFHCSSSSSETFCCNVLGSFGIVAHCAVRNAQHLSEKICLQGMSFCLAFQYISTQPSSGAMHSLQCVYVDSLLWAYLDKSVTLYQEEGKNGRLGKTNDLIKYWATTALPLVAMPKGEI